MIVVSLANVFIISLVNRYGTAVTAAFGIGMKVEMLAAIPAISIGIAATTVSGQNLGAGKMDRVFRTMRISLYYGLAIALACSIVLLIFPYHIGALFLKQSAEHAGVLGFVRDYYHWVAFIFPCFTVICVIQGVLRSAGDTMALLALSFTALIVIRIPLAYLLAGPFGFQQDGIWMAMLFSSELAVGLNWLYFKGGRWKKKWILGKEQSRST